MAVSDSSKTNSPEVCHSTGATSDRMLMAGYRVLDLTQGGCLLCGKILGDFGCDVIQVEPPGGNPSRNIGPFYKDIADPEKSLFWFAYCSNKRGITLNLESADGRELFKKLVATADFVIESFPPRYLDSQGLSYSELEKVNRRIIMVSITPFGQDGPKANYKASDITTWAASGYMYVTGDMERGPVQLSLPQSSLNGGAEAASAALIAHWHREMTGEGQHIDVSIQQCLIKCMSGHHHHWPFNKRIVKRAGFGFRFAKAMSQNGYRCKDGWVSAMLWGGGASAFVTASQNTVKWMAEDGMAPDWLKEFDWQQEFNASTVEQETVGRVEHAVATWLLTKTKKELFEEGAKRRTLFAPVNTAQDIMEDVHLKARGFWEEVKHPELDDTISYPGAFVKVIGAPINIRRCAPLVGEHNQEVYEEELGLSRHELILLKQAGVV